jgi:hypothetical protein
VAVRFDAGQPSVQKIQTRIKRANEKINVRYNLVSLPLYLVERLPELDI